MTREEAIERLNIHKSTSVFVDSIAEAIDMAIEALQTDSTIRKIAFACDGSKCGGDCSNCGRTTDIEHAKNFNHIGDIYFENLPGVGVFDMEHDNDDGVIKYTGENYKI